MFFKGCKQILTFCEKRLNHVNNKILFETNTQLAIKELGKQKKNLYIYLRAVLDYWE